jgi:hypothetical protein
MTHFFEHWLRKEGDMAAVIIVQKDKQILHYHPVSPNRWCGEVDCVIGPFSSKEVAEYFAGHTADFGQLGGIEEIVFAKRDEWFVEARALDDHPPRASL